jgi:HEAT repeat protein
VGTGRPNIKSLARRGDVAALIEATSYAESEPSASDPDTDSGASVRAEAIRALGSIGRDSGHEAIEAGLGDSSDSVRSTAVSVLHARRDGAALARALGTLPSDGESRELAILAIVDLRETVSASIMASALVQREDEELLDEPVARLFMELIEEEDSESRHAGIGVLVQALGDERGIVVDRAAELLVRLAPASIEALVTELKTGSAAGNSAYVLGRIGDPHTVSALVETLGHEDARVRRECSAALGEFDAREAVMPLLRATRDSDHGVRVQAAAALDRMGTSAVIVGVAALLEPMIHEAVQAARDQQQPRGSNGGTRDNAASRPRPRQPARWADAPRELSR